MLLVNVVVLCYGLMFQPIRTEAEMRGLKAYLTAVFSLIVELFNRRQLGNIEYCGGYTNPSYPTMSEAVSTFEWLLEENADLFDTSAWDYVMRGKTHCETQSVNSAQNIWFAVSILKKKKVDFRPWVVCCDKVRRPKIMALCFWISLLRGMPMPTVSAFDREDIHPNSNSAKQRKAALAYWLLGPLLIYFDLKKGRKPRH